MARSNTGKPSEALFEAHFERLGKEAVVIRMIDAADLFGRNNRRVLNVPPAPSDFIVTHSGHTFYAEVKSTEHPTLFTFKLLRKSQSSTGIRVVAAGGDYFAFIHSLALDQWFRVPYALIRATKAAGRASLSWVDLKEANLQWAISHA